MACGCAVDVLCMCSEVGVTRCKMLAALFSMRLCYQTTALLLDMFASGLELHVYVSYMYG